MVQDSAVEILHDNESAAVLLTDVMDGADVGVIQRGGSLRFALKTGKGQGIAGQLFREKL